MTEKLPLPSQLLQRDPIAQAAIASRITVERARVTCPLCNDGFTWQRDVAAGERVSLAEGMAATRYNGAPVHIECAKIAERKVDAIEA